MDASSRTPPWVLRNLSGFVVQDQIGEGVYGKVHRAQNREGELVALKRVKTDLTAEREGFPITALREIQILLALSHENVASLHEVALDPSDRSVYLVFEYLDHDLSGIMESMGAGITEDHVCCYVRQLVAGIAYVHGLHILHRDVKASNLLISSNGHLKIGDWGLARTKAGDAPALQHYTNRVITLWYRPPELLLGATRETDGYGPPIDTWSVGCIMAELLQTKPILPGNTEIEQLALIFDLCGSPTVETWPDVVNLPLWETFAPPDGDAALDSGDPDDDHNETKTRKLRERFSAFERTALDLVDQILVNDPKQRISAAAALDAPYLRAAKRPEELTPLEVNSAHEWEVRNRSRHAA
mmetsp:Transcript_24210/g.74633  ORF Transcript_24210/g.74633 Transcript_24210/m.74633 type:complete len:357 (+) Transcript_24210:826-1896(+)